MSRQRTEARKRRKGLMERPHPDEGEGDVEPGEHGQPEQDTPEPRAWMDEGPVPRIYRGEKRRNGEEHYGKNGVTG